MQTHTSSATIRPRTTRSHEKDTRQRIMDAAEEVFLEKGFDKATVREICKRAKANVAAINYHFSDKRDLYSRILEKWLDECFAEYPVGMGEATGMSPENRLYQYVRTTLSRLLIGLSSDGPELNLRKSRLFMSELTREQPNAEVLQKGHVEDMAHLSTIVAEISGLPPHSHQIVQMCMGIKAQCVHYFLVKLAGLTKFGETVLDDSIDAIARPITDFSLGGISRLKESAS